MQIKIFFRTDLNSKIINSKQVTITNFCMSNFRMSLLVLYSSFSSYIIVNIFHQYNLLLVVININITGIFI